MENGNSNTMKDKLTIVIPCKNEQTYIAHLLKDLQQQVGIGKTKIYIADASTDDTRKVILANKGNLNVSIIKGGPVSYAKNQGAKKAKTDYILFIDADVRFFNDYTIADALSTIQQKELDLLGCKIKCYDNDIRAKLGFALFNMTNAILSRFSPFAVGLFMMTRRDKFEEFGGFPDKYATSEDYFLSRNYSPDKFTILNAYAGQDSRRFKKMGYAGMALYLIKNFINRNNEDYWNKLDGSRYWT